LRSRSRFIILPMTARSGAFNFGNVASNLPFLIVAAIGLVMVVSERVPFEIRLTYMLGQRRGGPSLM
jgi:hypothetical protein